MSEKTTTKTSPAQTHTKTPLRPAQARAAKQNETGSGLTMSLSETFGEMCWADRIAFGGLMLLVFLVPLAMSNFTWLGFSLPFTYDQFDVPKVFVLRALTLIILAAWIWRISTKGGKLRFSPVLIGVGVFVAWVGLTTIFADHVPTALFGKYRRFEGFITFVNYAVLFFLTLQYADTPRRVRKLLQAFFFSLLIVSIYGVSQSLGFDLIKWGSLPFEAKRAFATYGNPDLLGGALALAVPISLGLALSEERTGWRIVYWAGFLLNCLCLVNSFVRGAWIGAAVGLVIFVAIAIIQKAPWRGVDWIFAGGSGGVAIAAAVASLASTDEVMNFAKRFASIFQFDSGSGQTRLQIWDAAIKAIKASPILGHGADTFRLLFPKYKPYDYVAAAGYRSVADNVHNYPLQLASGIGIPGVIFMYGTFIWTALVSGKTVFKRGGGIQAVMLGGLWAACAAYCVHLFFGISVVGTSFFLWMALAMLLQPSAKEKEIAPLKFGYVLGGAGIVVCAVLSLLNVAFVAADHEYLVGKTSTSDFAAAEAAMERSIKLNPYNDIYRGDLATLWIEQGYALSQTDKAAADIAFDEAEKDLKSVISYCPMEYDNYVYLANLYNMRVQMGEKQYMDKAIEAGKKAVAVEPYGPLARYQLAQAYLAAGNKAAAKKEAAYAAKMDPNYEAPRELLQEIEALETTVS